jgi:hypothetical protein
MTVLWSRGCSGYAENVLSNTDNESSGIMEYFPLSEKWNILQGTQDKSLHVRLKACLSMKNKRSCAMINLLDCTELIPLWRIKYSLVHVKHIPEWSTTILNRHVENTSLYRQKKICWIKQNISLCKTLILLEDVKSSPLKHKNNSGQIKHVSLHQEWSVKA